MTVILYLSFVINFGTFTYIYTHIYIYVERERGHFISYFVKCIKNIFYQKK